MIASTKISLVVLSLFCVLITTQAHYNSYGGASRVMSYHPVSSNSYNSAGSYPSQGSYGGGGQSYNNNRWSSSYSQPQQAMNSVGGDGIGASVASLNGDTGNTGGIHQTGLRIGGIQNFGGRYNNLIAKLTGDSKNTGGYHSSQVEIGGILTTK